MVLGVWRVLGVLEGFKGLEGFRGWQTASLDAHKKPLMWPWDACWLPALDAHKKGFRGFGWFLGFCSH